MSTAGDRVFEITLPRGGWVLIHYEFYVDETGGEDAGFPTMGVAGYLIRSDEARSFEEQWSAAIGDLPFIHMKEFAPEDPKTGMGVGLYSHMTKKERVELEIRLIEIIKKHVQIAVGAFAPERRFEADHGDEPFSFCLTQCALILDSLLEGKHGNDCKVAVYYEKGRKHGYKVVQFFEEREQLRITSVAPLEKERGLIQAADILTWLIAKYLKDTVSEKRAPRADFKSLMEVPGSFAHIYPFEDGISLLPFFNDSVLHPETMDKVREIYDPGIPLEELWTKYGATRVG